MLYFLLGILSIIAVQSILFMKYYERGLKINGKHMCISVLFSVYIIYIVEYLHDKVIHMNGDLLICTLLFIPVGLIMPVVYRHYKHFLTNAVYVFVLCILIFVLQNLSVGKINVLSVLFSEAGVLAGFVLSVCIIKMFPTLRKTLILKKRRKRIVVGTYELEIVTLCFVILFSLCSSAERISGQNFEQKLKDTINYSPDDKVNEKDDYADIYYADEDKYDRYDAYAALHPEMSAEEVVWRVDANLDQEFYDEDYVRYADEDTDEPLLINKFNRVSEDFKPELVQLEGTYESTAETAQAYKLLTDDLERLGMKIYVVSSYRSIAYQDNLYRYYLKSDTKEEVDTYSSRPGYSEHHTGRAIDISQVANNLNAFEGSAEAAWVYANAYKYGFIVRYKEEQMDVTGYIFEPWHIVYVGTDISTTMHDENIETLEEYVVKYVEHHRP